MKQSCLIVLLVFTAVVIGGCTMTTSESTLVGGLVGAAAGVAVAEPGHEDICAVLGAATGALIGHSVGRDYRVYRAHGVYAPPPPRYDGYRYERYRQGYGRYPYRGYPYSYGGRYYR